MKSKILLDSLAFPESPRWRHGKLWFSDMHARKVMTVDLQGNVEVVFSTENNPSGLGWLPDGRLLVVSMEDRRLLSFDGNQLSQFADLGKQTPYICNDMAVDSDGYAYIGNFGFNIGEEMKRTNLLGVSPQGEVKEVARGVIFPNGMVITPDGKTLIVAESFGNQLTAFDINPDKSLSNQRAWAPLTDFIPDGIALDSEGGVWVASTNKQVITRVEEGGKITDSVDVSQNTYAAAVGGPDNKTLFVCTSVSVDSNETLKQMQGRIEIVPLS